jgi:hypothetical protein
MSQHEDFLRGFGDAMGLSDLLEIERHYQVCLQAEGRSEVERIDYETAG